MEAQPHFTSTRTPKVETKLGNIFYPLVVLLICWPRACNYPFEAKADIDQPPPSNSSRQQQLRAYVSRLAFLCWTSRDPDYISACAVLNGLDNTVEYVFTSNNRSSSQLDDLKEKMRSILNMFRETPTSEGARMAILQRILSLCVDRVTIYLVTFKRNLDSCIEDCNNTAIDGGAAISAPLRELQQDAERALPSPGSGAAVNISEAARLVWSIHIIYKSHAFSVVRDRAHAEERKGTDNHWTEFIHAAGRLMTYKQAVDVSLNMRRAWPELFQDFQITMVQASRTSRPTLNNRILTAEGIIGKIDRSKAAELTAALDKLSVLGLKDKLDEAIRKEWTTRRKSKYTCVHAEINLFQYLEMTAGGTDKSRFFFGDAFIGSSKPPCKLCCYFFRAYPTAVEVSASHRNLYGTWLVPDIAAEQTRTNGGIDSLEIGRLIRERLVSDLLQVVRAGGTDGRPHDSSNYSTQPGPQRQQLLEAVRSTTLDPLDESRSWERAAHSSREIGPIYTPASLDTITSDITSLSLQCEEEREITTSTAQNSQTRTNTALAGHTVSDTETGDDSDGGVLLFRGRGGRQSAIRRRL